MSSSKHPASTSFKAPDSSSLQLNDQGKLRHFLTTDGLSKQVLTEIMDVAESFSGVAEQAVKKVPLLRGQTIANLFFENSTRTRTTFDLAAKRLSADVINLNIATSATTKGESILDTIRHLGAMPVVMFIVRHADSGAAHFIARHVAPHISVINAGDGRHAHPTQAMLDMFTIRRVKKDFKRLKVAIIGDILHSRVARSQIHALNTLGVREVRVIAPKTLVSSETDSVDDITYGVQKTDRDQGDEVIMVLVQWKRIADAVVTRSGEYAEGFVVHDERFS